MAKKPKVFSKKEAEKKLKALPEWSLNAKATQISRTFKPPNFVTALALCAKIAVHAEVMGHHPDLELSYGKVKVKLTTHDVKGLTKKDFELAGKIEKLKTT